MSYNSLHTTITQRARDFERNLAACTFVSADITSTTCAWVDPNWFSDKRVARFWQECKKTNNGVQAAASVSNDFVIELMDWVNQCPNTSIEEVYARQLHNTHIQRDVVLGALSNIAQMLHQNADIDDMQAEALRIAQSLPENRKSGKTALESHEIFEEHVEAYSNANSGVAKTHIPDIDNIIGGMEAGQVILIAADTSVGKTALSLQIARENAREANANGDGAVLYFSLEMTVDQVWQRIACGATQIDYRKVVSGKLTPLEKKQLIAESKKIANLYGDKLVIVDDIYTIEGIRAECAQYKPSLVIIDHLEEVEPIKKVDEHLWRGKAITYAKQHIAKRFNIPVIIVHQLNRDLSKRQDKRPQLSDLRQDGTIEQKIDVCIFLYREDYYSGIATTSAPTEIIFRKFRQGQRNLTTLLEYDLEQQWFFSGKQYATSAYKLKSASRP